MTKKVLLWGGKSKSRIIAAMIDNGISGDAIVSGVFDTSLTSLDYDTDVPFFNNIESLNLSCYTHFAVCIGGEYGYARWLTGRAIEKAGLSPLQVISNHAVFDLSAKAGDGLQMMPGSIVHKFCTLGDFCIVNTNATVDHECTLGDGVHVMGSAALAGRIQVGDFATIGTNATILPDLEIGEGAYIGAGSVVTKDVPAHAIVTGVPARVSGTAEIQVNQELLQQFAAANCS